MASFKARKVKSSLLKEGFVEVQSHHQYFEFWHNGQFILKTYTSHSGEDINAYLASAMSKQCEMDKPFFVEFIECTKSREDYVAMLLTKNIITR